MELKDQATVAKDDDSLALRVAYENNGVTYYIDMGSAQIGNTAYTIYTITSDQPEAHISGVVKVLSPQEAERRDVLAAFARLWQEHPTLGDALITQYIYNPEADACEPDCMLYEFVRGNYGTLMLRHREGEVIWDFEIVGPQRLIKLVKADIHDNALTAAITGASPDVVIAHFTNKYGYTITKKGYWSKPLPDETDGAAVTD